MTPREWRECHLCGGTAEHRHHVYFGTANRKMSEKYGMTVMLCARCHAGVHMGGSADKLLKMGYQAVFEQSHTREEFRAIFGKSYL